MAKLEVVKEKLLKIAEAKNVTILNLDNIKDGDHQHDIIEYKCNVCGDTFTKVYGEFIRTERNGKPIEFCNTCKSHNHFLERFNEVYGFMPYEIGDQKIRSSKDIIHVKCKKCGAEWDSTVDLLLRGKNTYPCKSCHDRTMSKEELEKVISDYYQDRASYTIVTEQDRYTMSKNILFKCNKCGNVFSCAPITLITPTAASGVYCSQCNHVKKKTLEEYKTDIKDIDETIQLLDYNKETQLFKCLCKKCGRISYRYMTNIKAGNKCKYCAGNGTSKAEKEIGEFLKTIPGLEIKEHDRQLLKDDSLELDFVIENKKVAIEYDGLYYHSSRTKPNNYHLTKTKLCAKKGYRLIHIFEDEWLNKQELCKNKLKHILGVDDSVHVYGRKCVIKEISIQDKNEFLEANHIQGSDTAPIKLGLYYNDNLVAVMTFSKNRISLGRSNVEDEYELSRYATSCNVVGGFGKLLKYFIKTYNPKVIRTYADLRWSSYPGLNKTIYDKYNFNLVHITKPNYFYCNNQTRYHRFSFRKSLLESKFPDVYDENLSEFEIMDKTSFSRIYDCGNICYEFINPKMNNIL